MMLSVMLLDIHNCELNKLHLNITQIQGLFVIATENRPTSTWMLTKNHFPAVGCFIKKKRFEDVS